MRKKQVRLLTGFLVALMGVTLFTTTPATMVSMAATSSASSEKSSGDAPSSEAPSGEAPEKPDGETSGEAPSGEAPEKPDGDSSGEAPSGEAPSGEAPSGEAPSGEAPSGGGPGGQSTGVDSYTAVTEFTLDDESTDETYTSTGTDENAILNQGVEVILNNPTVTRTSEDSTGGDNSSFYGVGAAILGTSGTTYVNGGSVTTDSAGGAGIFSYGDNVTYAQGVTINTTQDTSGGLHAAGGGTLYAWGCDVTTNGESSAAIRSDRGGGTMVVDGGTYTSNGTGSPAVYCTADITVNDATLNATGSEGICIEGLNSLRIFDSDLTCNMPDNEQNETTWSVILYQSMSGDSEEGNSTFEMVGGSITSENGGIFYTTNTESTFYLNDVTITSCDDSEYFLRATGNTNARGWGSTGSNGAQCNFTADTQAMSGDVVWDSVSTLDFYMTNGSSLTGAVVDDESAAGEGGDGYCNMYISDDSTWTVTGDSTLTNLYNEGTIVDGDGKTVSIVGTDGTVYVEGTSDITITVASYSEEADFSGSAYSDGETPSFATYEVEKPDCLTANTLGTEAETAELASTTSKKGVMAGFVGLVALVVVAAIFAIRRKFTKS